MCCINEGDWYEYNLSEYDGFVCTAGLIGEDVCSKQSFSRLYHANVTLPASMMHEAKERRKPFIAFSTAAVYRDGGKVDENSDVHPWNRYATSKIMMEYELNRRHITGEYSGAHRFYIFRLPFVDLKTDHKNDLKARASRWESVEEVTTSIALRKEILEATLTALTKWNWIASGTYNIASLDVFLPKYLMEEFNIDLRKVPANSLGLSPGDKKFVTTKAENEGLIARKIRDPLYVKDD